MAQPPDEDILGLIAEVYGDGAHTPSERTLTKALEQAEQQQRVASVALKRLERHGTPARPTMPRYVDSSDASLYQAAPQARTDATREAAASPPTETPPVPSEPTQVMNARELTRRVKQVVGGHLVAGRGRELAERERTQAHAVAPLPPPSPKDKTRS